MSARRTKAASPPRIVGVMALDRRGDGAGQAPATGQDAADERVVDAQLAALAMHALLGRPGVAVDLLRIAGVGMGEHELADVVQQGGDHEAVTMLVAGLLRQAIGGALGGDAVQAEALRARSPRRTSARRSRTCGCGSAIAWTDSGDRTSTALTIESTRPREPVSSWLATRSTLMTSAMSDSTAATTSPGEMRSAVTRRRRRLRDSARAGNASSASKAAVRRRPWPSLWCRWAAP